MSGIYIPMKMPKPGAYFCELGVLDESTAVLTIFDTFDEPRRSYKLVPVPDHGRLLKVLKTERECVSRDCDRNCGKCELSLERNEILSAYDTLISMFSDPADKEGKG